MASSLKIDKAISLITQVCGHIHVTFYATSSQLCCLSTCRKVQNIQAHREAHIMASLWGRENAKATVNGKKCLPSKTPGSPFNPSIIDKGSLYLSSYKPLEDTVHQAPRDIGRAKKQPLNCDITMFLAHCHSLPFILARFYLEDTIRFTGKASGLNSLSFQVSVRINSGLKPI